MAEAELILEDGQGGELIITKTGEPPLSESEGKRFKECSEIIDAGIVSFVLVGAAIKEVVEKRYFREDYLSVEEWAKATFDIGRSRVYKLIDAADVVIGDLGIDISVIRNDSRKLSQILDSHKLPKNEAQASALLGAPKEKRAAIWKKTVEKYGDKVTAKCVANTIREEIGARIEEEREKVKREPSDNKKQPYTPFIDAFDAFLKQVSEAYMNEWENVPKKDVVKRLKSILNYIENH